MNRRLAKRLQWFDDGAPMLRLVAERLGVADQFPDDQGYYACPCCFMVYNRTAVFEAILTEEHVPAESVGGHGMVLTCKPCNDRSGQQFDHHASTRRMADEFVQGTWSGRPARATMHVDGIPLRGTVQRNGDSMQLFGVWQQNDPKVQAEFLAAADKYVESGDPSPNVRITMHTKFSEARARLSTIRSAYLAAFAAFGYTYITQPEMAPYREQMTHPDQAIVPTYLATDHAAPSDFRQILVVTEPDDVRCIAVTIGRETVYLPGIRGLRPQTCEQLIEALKKYVRDDQRLSVPMSGKAMPWPRSAIYFLDRPKDQVEVPV